MAPDPFRGVHPDFRVTLLLNDVWERLLYICKDPTIASAIRSRHVPGPELMAAFHLPEFPAEPVLGRGYRRL